MTADGIRKQLRGLGITEDVFVHEQDYDQFIREKGIKELGRGGEGAVYFLRGHAVKVVNSDSAPSALREIAHMLHLNRMIRGGAMGDRARLDWPALLWVYILSDGSLSVGMKPFDLDGDVPGSTLYERLNFGPALERGHVLRIIRSIAHSLLYSERQGIVHHDLKPANLFVPGNPRQEPVVFDLGQALWRQSAWGRYWLKHVHNFHYWYNGTYPYMHHLRRLSHLAALACARGQQPTPAQAEAFERYVPTFYDDVFAFLRILHDFARSRHALLQPADRVILAKFYQRLMGLQRKRIARARKTDPGLFTRLKSMFEAAPAQPSEFGANARKMWGSMEHVVPELEKCLAALNTAAPHK